MTSDTDPGLHFPAILLNIARVGVRLGSGAVFNKTGNAHGTTKVHRICAGSGFPFIESPDEIGDKSRISGYEPGLAIGCKCCRGRTDSAVSKHLTTTNGAIYSTTTKSDASDIPEITKVRAVHCTNGAEIENPFHLTEGEAEFTHVESFGR